MLRASVRHADAPFGLPLTLWIRRAGCRLQVFAEAQNTLDVRSAVSSCQRSSASIGNLKHEGASRICAKGLPGCPGVQTHTAQSANDRQGDEQAIHHMLNQKQ